MSGINRQLNDKCGVAIGEVINLLKPTSYLMHQYVNIQQLYALATLYLCFVFISEQIANCATYHKLVGFYNRVAVFTARYELGL
jgi:hypothetical protein